MKNRITLTLIISVLALAVALVALLPAVVVVPPGSMGMIRTESNKATLRETVRELFLEVAVEENPLLYETTLQKAVRKAVREILSEMTYKELLNLERVNESMFRALNEQRARVIEAKAEIERVKRSNDP